MSAPLPAIDSSHNLPEQPVPMSTKEGHVADIQTLLNAFDGESSLKRLFWEILSFDRIRDPLSLSLLPSSSIDLVAHLEVFAATEAITVVYAELKTLADGSRIQQMCWSLKGHINNCIVLMHDLSSWTVVIPDDSRKPQVRILPLPGLPQQRHETAKALAALSAADPISGEMLPSLAVSENLDMFFPGAMPNLDDFFSGFERITRHRDPQVRELTLFIKEAGKYPLLTFSQECGEDIPASGKVAPDGTDLDYQQWRLVVHNLRLVLWVARKCGGNMEFADRVQEGAIGLLIAARKYDPSRETRFSTYAFFWVRQRIWRAMQDSYNLIRWPVWIAPKLISACLKGEQEGLPPGEKPVVYVPWNLSFASMEGPDLLDFVAREETCAAVRKVLAKLKGMHRKVIARRFGIGFDHEHTLQEVGDEFRLTRERIRQIEAEALAKLRGALGTELLVHYNSSHWRVQKAPEFENVGNVKKMRGFTRKAKNVAAA